MNHHQFHHKIEKSIREIVFGLEDSLVTSLGTVTGVAVGTQNTFAILLSGVVVIFTSVMSMSAGSYLSSKATEQANGFLFYKQKWFSHSFRAAWVMGLFYLFGGFIPLIPYFFLSPQKAIFPAILLTAFALFFIGFWSGHYTKRQRVRSGIEMLCISLGAALIGSIIGQIAHLIFGNYLI
ncbi:MAG: hypothetical protein UU08_C0009G0010 [Candidatus Uhrbacteria bacterium GW2011_GWE2_40_58]|nr:MAG: hypothetical protein UT94_C0017G0013 [Candidatus Uhrbacteria bacterium GW2011_GWF2_40_263]KKR67748.1 MAG: hypothetical protein UU08_C0009G0010 [Candidatus Uhrbacteria bacterium GW2011_GWE2_40_58]OGL92189.1 MAG: hypothetical protein A2239_02970 [Candidatus Uhrbacteria bacterium RIFOXYA2_FULL_40_9]OGL96724.1 MAG: hypothetical protein A2332_00390 [Candidatus Uhrbacteria bacterium RIFOXYB2_FULL_41_18]HBK35303.1 hypothetical protein [Candidatus Uhrbacteria bacterium]